MRAILAAAFVALLPLTADAQSASDRAAIQSVITGQIEAFRRDDASSAYAAASPGIQGKFLNPEIFMSMVAGGYAPLYRPKSFAFGPLSPIGGSQVQHLFVIGPDGVAYTAVYIMEQEADGSWRIDGVGLERDDGPSI